MIALSSFLISSLHCPVRARFRLVLSTLFEYPIGVGVKYRGPRNRLQQPGSSQPGAL